MKSYNFNQNHHSKENIYCKFCRKIINSAIKPSENDWDRFRKCKCLQKTNKTSKKSKKFGGTYIWNLE